ncbi:hypothetical protein RBH26_12690 [Natronolimnohabitans sp. A-GB9]|uniref:hypothetical protein n=1 Tax=Natronolimnohabitans sp. A-GB9 TaxID=3069757 RepID=UPI0027B84371|nr:hypothetical protein [Natronolimnohabitans sp. A-GB9]MDQ2051337.1 hypothetical protein [Natronolimnohabitans sp. A-GB9]
MPETEQQEETLSEVVVKEAVSLGMESPLRDTILEAVEEAEGAPSGGSKLPLAGALFGIGAALGFLAGRQSTELEEASLEDVDEPEIIEDVMEGRGGDETESTTDVVTETETDIEDEGGSSRLPKLLLAVGAVAAIAIARRRLSGDEEEEWEPIEEFEPATTDEFEEPGDDELEAGTGDGDETHDEE